MLRYPWAQVGLNRRGYAGSGNLPVDILDSGTFFQSFVDRLRGRTIDVRLFVHTGGSEINKRGESS
jgi:hypothetical protein